MVLTGAGISAESGLPTFRDSGGLWEKYDVYELASPEGWAANPGLVLDFYNYRILGACNPPFAYKALQAEDKIGTMLPCNVIVQEKTAGQVEVSAIDPAASMQAVKNDNLAEVASDIRNKLKRVIESL